MTARRAGGNAGKGNAGSRRKTGGQSNRTFITIVGLILLGGGAVLGYILTRPKPAPIVLDPNAPPLVAQGYVIGSDSAPVEIVEYADFECPQCGYFATIIEPDVKTRLVDAGLARFRFMDFPVKEIHPSSLIAHNAGACANAQGKFWQMKDRIFAGQAEWSTILSPRAKNAEGVFRGYAQELGLDTRAFNACLSTRAHQAQIEANHRDGLSRGVNGTPSFIIGGRLIEGRQPFDVIKAMVDSARVIKN